MFKTETFLCFKMLMACSRRAELPASKFTNSTETPFHGIAIRVIQKSL